MLLHHPPVAIPRPVRAAEMRRPLRVVLPKPAPIVTARLVSAAIPVRARKTSAETCPLPNAVVKNVAEDPGKKDARIRSEVKSGASSLAVTMTSPEWSIRVPKDSVAKAIMIVVVGRKRSAAASPVVK